MSTLQTIQATDLISTSRTDINANFIALNNEKIETSTLSTDSTLAANSDAKIATQKAVKAYVDAGGNVNASETARGIVEEATDAEVTAGTATGATGAKLFITPAKLATASGETGVSKLVKTKSTGLLDTSIIPSAAKFIGVGNSSNTTYENYKLYFGLATGTGGVGWTSWGAPTYYVENILTGSAVGIYKNIINMITGAIMTFANAKIKILEWDALIQADASTGSSFMGYLPSGNTAADIIDSQVITNTKIGIGFRTNDSGNWFIYTGTGAAVTATSISNPSAGKHTFRIEYNPTTPNALFYIDGSLVGTITTTFPNSGNAILCFGNGTTSVIVQALSAPMLAIEK